METDILDSLEDLGYQGPVLEDGSLDAAVSGGAESPEFTKLCAWIVSELKVYCKLEENVHATNCPSEAEGFQLEVSGLLAELACPYTALTSGDATQRLLNKSNCLLLLTFLISELEASRMVLINQPQKKVEESGGSDVFMELKGICVGLGMSKPPANITMFQFFSGIEKKLKEAMSKVPPNHVGAPLLKKPLGPVHWEKIEAINQALVNEYDVRRKMLLKRLDVTVQSFGWSERAKTHSEKLAKVYQPLRAALNAKTVVSVAHLYAARIDLSKIMRTSSGRIREKTACAINKILMGRVPDRGGRPYEIEPPPPEMPSWQKRQDGPSGGFGGGQHYGGGGRGGGGGGRGEEGEEAEGAKFRVAGQMVEVVVEAIMVTTKMDMEGVIRWEGGEGVMEEEEEEEEEEEVGDTKAIKEVQTILEVEVTKVEADTKVEPTSTTTTIKTGAATRREGAGADAVAEEGEAAAGEKAGAAEAARTTTRADSLNSSFSTEAISTTRRASARATTRAETAQGRSPQQGLRSSGSGAGMSTKRRGTRRVREGDGCHFQAQHCSFTSLSDAMGSLKAGRFGFQAPSFVLLVAAY
ncbi:hypothetical protein AALO_G00236340 [Alosa alosa]|uniref:Protein FAM98A n=1 Tax=Alosa alosa TaxID=278164 RepID=A0AAV6FVQ4_9TELE|nr:hypothetical protein AALO_G00236340 [Alosa alosa]